MTDVRQRVRWYRYLRATKPWGVRKCWWWAGFQARAGFRR